MRSKFSLHQDLMQLGAAHLLQFRVPRRACLPALGLMPGIFVGWTVYLTAAEEIHWRIHMEGWLPPGLGFARAYHMSHHDIPNTRYNVFLSLCDFLLGNSRLPRASHGLKQRG
jgi:hypothetical protein